jgi:hypothetical protein
MVSYFFLYRVEQVIEMGSRVKEIGLESRRFGAVKSLGLLLKLPGFRGEAAEGVPGYSAMDRETCRSQLLEIECQKARAKADAQRAQISR